MVQGGATLLKVSPCLWSKSTQFPRVFFVFVKYNWFMEKRIKQGKNNHKNDAERIFGEYQRMIKKIIENNLALGNKKTRLQLHIIKTRPLIWSNGF